MRYSLLLLGLALAARPRRIAPAGRQTDRWPRSPALALGAGAQPAAAGRRRTAARRRRRRAASGRRPRNPVRRAAPGERGRRPLRGDRFATRHPPARSHPPARARCGRAGASRWRRRWPTPPPPPARWRPPSRRSYWRSALADALARLRRGTQAVAMAEIAAFEETRLREGAVAEGVVLRTRLEARAGPAGARARGGGGASARTPHWRRRSASPPQRVPPRAGSPPPAPPEPSRPRRRRGGARPRRPPGDGGGAAARGGGAAGRERRLARHPPRRRPAGRRDGAPPATAPRIAGLSPPVPAPRPRRGGAGSAPAGSCALAEAELAAARGGWRRRSPRRSTSTRRSGRRWPAERQALAERGAEIAADRRGGVPRGRHLAGGAAGRASAPAPTPAPPPPPGPPSWRIARIELNRALGAPIGEGL